MTLTVLCSIVIIFYVIIWFFDSFFKSCMHYPYYAFLNGTGLKVGFLNLSWTTTAFNRSIYRWSKRISRFLIKWFTLGYVVTIYLFLPYTIWTIFTYLYHYFFNSPQLGSASEVKAVLPGVNMPTSDFWAYFISLAVSSIIHELGHAMAASNEGIQLLGIGVYIFAIIPIVYVQLNPEQLSALTASRRLKILCAGIWHNIACSFIAMLLIFSTPMLFSIGYVSGIGMRVTGFSYDSPLRDQRGLETKDVITALNGCEVRNMNDWSFCLYMLHERFGICTSAEYIAQNDEVMMESIVENSVIECCGPSNEHNFCFEYMEPKVAVDSVLPVQYSCLKPREMIKHKLNKCTEVEGYMCHNNMHCMKPVLHNYTHLMIIERLDKDAVIYLGLQYDIQHTVSVDQYFPRSAFFARFSPMEFEKLMQYIFTFSLGLAFINMLPSYSMDGHYISNELIKLFTRHFDISDAVERFLTIFTVVIGTGVAAPFLLLLVYKALSASDGR